ncbi:MAG: sulfatase-like hydrolase/transferase, partial [Planctomycetaceae bacterium]|nr:sulfatase-like hydrolase/transferase [Planctomycetaceae bacterium]
MKSRRFILLTLAAFLVSQSAADCRAQSQPNILWITVEDMSPILGCYGDSQAITPHLDQFAKQSVRYSHAFASAPVCSPARSCLITGCYAPSLGTHSMRSAFPLPEGVRGFPSILRDHGYFTSNNEKTDYNTRDSERLIQACWNVSSATAHWRDRPNQSQPFFSVFNLMTTHQSRTMVWPTERFVREIQSHLTPHQIHDPLTIPLPPYYPDTPVARREWARLYDCVTRMDEQVGELLQQLEDDGLADNTIVFFFSDHGSGMPRHKRTLLDTGMHVPLMIRFPPRYADLAPSAPGTIVDQLVSFVDFPPSILSLAGLARPPQMQGVTFLGPDAGSSRQYVFGHRDRVDEAFDLARSVRSHRYLYIRNFMPHLGYNQPTAWPDQGELRGEFYRLSAEGTMTEAQRQFAGPNRPIEELYDCQFDPLNLRNLATDPQHQAIRTELANALQQHLRDSSDLGPVPESVLFANAQALSQAAPTGSGRFPEQRFRRELAQTAWRAADAVGSTDADRLMSLLQSGNVIENYWGSIAICHLTECPLRLKNGLETLSQTGSPIARVAAAEAMVRHGDIERGIGVLREFLGDSDLNVVLAAMRALEILDHVPTSQPAASTTIDTSAAAEDVRRLADRCQSILPPSTTATFVQTPEQDLAMFIGFSAGAWLKRHE